MFYLDDRKADTAPDDFPLSEWVTLSPRLRRAIRSATLVACGFGSVLGLLIGFVIGWFA